MDTKICNACNLELDLSFFGKWKYSSDGYENRCKSCKKKLRKKFSHTCLNCGKEFESNKKEQSYCSKKCYYPAQKVQMTGENNPNYARVVHICDGCGKEHLVIPCILQKQKRVYCGFDCYKKHSDKFKMGVLVKNVELTCSVCGNVFYRKPHETKRHKHLFCSRECYFKATGEMQRNKHLDKRVERKCATCGEIVSFAKSAKKNNKRVYCSRECKDKGITLHYSGENHAKWDPTRSYVDRVKERSLLDYKQWRIAVYERDGYTCQCCLDSSGGNLVAHHLNSWDKNEKLRFDVNNGTTLCKTCHIDFHRTYGYGNNTIYQYNEWLTSTKIKVLT